MQARRRRKLHAAYQAIEARTKAARKPWLESGLVLVLVGVLLAPDLVLFAEPSPEARDRSPGLQVAAGPYRRPEGCPARLTWRVGDWVAWPCRHKGNVLLRDQLDDYGLGRPRRRSRRGRAMEQEWIRVGPDALLIQCGRLIGCRATRVVADRFSNRAQIEEPQPA